MTSEDTTPKIQIDSDWKAEAQAEKERLDTQEQAKSEKKAQTRGKLPDADFRGLVSMLASQAIMGLGTMTDPKTGGVVIDLEGSRFSIDLLGVLEEKTKGNLTEEEATELTQLNTELRNRFVEVTKLVAQHAAAPSPTGDIPLEESKPAAGGIIMPD